jgi:hypothetical protein
MSHLPLTQKELLTLGDTAEYGDLDHTTASKRHVRILTSLYYITNKDKNYDHYYSNVDMIRDLIERIFEKRYTNEQLQYWIDDLCKRGYLSERYENTCIPNNFFCLTLTGIELFLQLKETSPDLFDSSSYTDLVFIN